MFLKQFRLGVNSKIPLSSLRGAESNVSNGRERPSESVLTSFFLDPLLQIPNEQIMLGDLKRFQTLLL